MKNIEILELAVNSIRYRSLRSWLAILGVVIGVASVISLISISTGMNEQMQSQLSGLGANLITVSSGGGRAMGMGLGGGGPPGEGFGGKSTTTTKPLTFKEANALRQISGVKAVDARLSENKVVTYMNKNASLSVIGTEPTAFLESANAQILYGRSLRANDVRAVVIGYSVMNNTFSDTNILNKQIKINNQTFQVVGILNTTGNTFSSSDRVVYIPINTAKTLFGQNANASSIIVVTDSDADQDEVAGNITQTLLTLHRLKTSKQDFQVTTAASIQSSVSSMTDTLGLFLGVIASISLFVGGIGVANAMFTSVLEQTKYIGILKSLGTTSVEVMKLFLFEAGLVGLVGGLMGVAISFIVSFALASFGVPTKITFELVVMGMGFSVIVGALSGVFPARNAASVAPVEALRYE
ncbi:MAG: ABC transporter permease [Candidatus Micrarchaeia archaeon]